MSSVLSKAFFDRDAEEVARDLLGVRLSHESGDVPVTAEIVETEAYTGPEDAASHAAARVGRTVRNAAMFLPAGHLYVYRSYGIHWCLNVVTGPAGHPAAVLIRAARPLTGWEAIRGRRAGRADRDLLRGPGNLCRGLGIDGALDTHPVDRPPLRFLARPSGWDAAVLAGPRIGISRAVDRPLRFLVADSLWVSGRGRSA